jgi:MFS transporter, AAHS family, 4-hydroxybenzoate transporter
MGNIMQAMDTAAGPATIELTHAVDSSGWSPFQVRVFCLIGLAVIFDGFDNQVLGFALPALLVEWGLDKSAFAPVLSISLVGMTCGAALAGSLGDRFGRKGVLIACVALFGIMTALSSLSGSLLVLGATRFVAALGLGGAMPNAVALIAEYTPSRSRALAISFAAVCIPLGGFLGGFIAAAVLPTMGWRALFLIAGIAPLIFSLLLLVMLPESPAYLLRIAGAQHRVVELLRQMGIAVPPGSQVVDRVQRLEGRGQLGQLFAPALRRDTIALGAAFFACLLAVYACFNWLPTLMTQNGYDLATASIALTIFNLGGVVAALVGGWAADRFGTRLPLSLLAGCVIVAALLLAIVPLGQTAMLAALLLLGAGVAGAQSVLTALAAHVFPTSIRSTGVGFSVGFGRAGGILSAFVGAYALTLGGSAAFFGTLGLAGLGALLAINLVRRHTPRP